MPCQTAIPCLPVRVKSTARICSRWPTIFSRLRSFSGSSDRGAPDRGVTLAIDRRTVDEGIDPLDATWVQTDDAARILSIGKHIETYDAVDCGAFLATPELAGAIEEAIAQGRPGSLSDGMQVLADRGRAATMDIGTAWWLDVDDAQGFALATRRAPQYLPEIFARRVASSPAEGRAA
jgi:1L-myo-inositol 1-phosphate cytidylyltransferase